MSAYGDDPRHHAIKDDEFVCTAPADAPCRTSPTCECENWCACDGSPDDARDTHGEGGHCCMTTTKAGQGCWLGPWVDAAGLGESYANQDDWPNVRIWAETNWPEGPVTCDWADGVFWRYAPAEDPA